jgi:hypothetical protein
MNKVMSNLATILIAFFSSLFLLNRFYAYAQLYCKQNILGWVTLPPILGKLMYLNKNITVSKFSLLHQLVITIPYAISVVVFIFLTINHLGFISLVDVSAKNLMIFWLTCTGIWSIGGGIFDFYRMVQEKRRKDE